MVRLVDSPGFKLHVDIACMHLASEDCTQIVKEHADIIYHVHISEPYLEKVWNGGLSPHHEFAKVLNEELFENDVLWSIEMKAGKGNEENVGNAIEFVKKVYVRGE